ncbi:MAG: PHB depolymerase family esterase [Candidatus Baltobacteraceae bacterium]
MPRSSTPIRPPGAHSERRRKGRRVRDLRGAVLAAACLVLCACGPHDERLGSYNVDPAKTVVAGVSSGAFMAVQLHVAYSKTFHAAAVYAGGPFDCARGTFDGAMACAVRGANLAQLEATTDRWSAEAAIDPVSNLKGESAYLWSGSRDRMVEQRVMNQLQSFYRHYGVATAYERSFPAGHGWESPYGEAACGSTRIPFVLDCDTYDSERTWLERFLGPLRPKNAGTLRGRLVPFDQSEFTSAAASMDRRGWIFVPADCADGKTCALVVALHGCLQNQSLIGTTFAREAGLDQWADTNGIIVLYPNAAMNLENPAGCWDWWGYTGRAYARKSGPQMRAIASMVERIEAGIRERSGLDGLGSHDGAIAEPARKQRLLRSVRKTRRRGVAPGAEPSSSGVRY